MAKKIAAEAGADQRTPSIPQYFSWINNTNEGSTEAQTLINLDFFAWLKAVYGMEIKIYAWDAGNFDGASMGYGDPDGEKFRSQYPNGYGPVVAKAAESGIRLGLWGSPDGFGDTPEEERKRYDFMVDLCRKHHFALFKVDGVCGRLRPEKAGVYASMLRDCRKYSPDLIVLNHRLNLYEAEKHATTSLWKGQETYVDVHSANEETCMHHRGFIFDRGLPDGLDRLMEDHGVCISSSVAYFEDDLIYQAFGRTLILAPEIYGNPWLMRDDEYPKLARIYNLHKKCAPILVDGMALPESYGHTPVSRGTDAHRFITTGNNSWKTRTITVRLDEEIGLKVRDEKIALIRRHPGEQLIGIYAPGDQVQIELSPFRACLLEAAVVGEAYPVLENCEYEVIREDADGAPVEIKMLYTAGGEISMLANGSRSVFGSFEAVDIRPKAPVYLATMADNSAAVSRGEELYEAAQFGLDNDSLEARELRRSGPTAVPQVQAARDAFFGQKTYIYRGCESRFAFDGNSETFFDAYSRFYGFDNSYGQGLRIDGGCLRVDFGRVYDADTVEITCFEIDEPVREVPEQLYPEKGSYGVSFAEWHDSGKCVKSIVCEHAEAPVVRDSVHTLYTVSGKRVKVCYPVSALRYFRLPGPMDRIYSIRLLKDGKALELDCPCANNLQAPYGAKTVSAVKSCTFVLPAVADGEYLAIALNGEHGHEGAYCVAEIDGQLTGCPDRASAYRVNVWECRVRPNDRNYTYYLPLDASMSGKEITLHAMFCDPEKTDVCCDVYLCPAH